MNRHSASSSFLKATKRAKPTPFAYAYDNLIREIRTLTRDDDNIDHFEPEFRAAFKKFLTDLNMPLALKNFEALLDEKSGKKLLRADGTVNWYHEFIPLLEMMSLARAGHKNNGFDIKDLEPYGGLETLICTHLRHDSREDVFDTDEAMNDHLIGLVEQIKKEHPDYDAIDGFDKIMKIMTNIDLISQKRFTNPDGTTYKEDVNEYIYRMVTSQNANPIVFMCKQADINHNFATLLGADKFTPERRLKRCNEREDMYGRRYGVAGIAMRQWKPFEKAIISLDGKMGFMLYSHFRYIINVDRYHKKPLDYPVDIYPYMPAILNSKLPMAVDTTHISIKRMMNSVDPVKDPVKYDLLQRFMTHVMMPPLEPYKSKFPYLFQNSVANQPASQPVVALN